MWPHGSMGELNSLNSTFSPMRPTYPSPRQLCPLSQLKSFLNPLSFFSDPALAILPLTDSSSTIPRAPRTLSPISHWPQPFTPFRDKTWFPRCHNHHAQDDEWLQLLLPSLNFRLTRLCRLTTSTTGPQSPHTWNQTHPPGKHRTHKGSWGGDELL